MNEIRKFWNWKAPENDAGERVLFINGDIASESWFEDDVTPKLFHDELFASSGPVTIWINSLGGDCIAAAQIYNMLMDYPGSVTVKIDGIAASAASVIAMAGTTVLMSPVGLLMIHNPATLAYGNRDEMQKAIEMLDSVKESIINAYEIKTGLSRSKLSHLMDEEKFMYAQEAMEYGFIDGILDRESNPMPEENIVKNSTGASPVQIQNSIMRKIAERCRIEPEETGVWIADLEKRLNLLK